MIKYQQQPNQQPNQQANMSVNQIHIVNNTSDSRGIKAKLDSWINSIYNSVKPGEFILQITGFGVITIGCSLNGFDQIFHVKLCSLPEKKLAASVFRRFGTALQTGNISSRSIGIYANVFQLFMKDVFDCSNISYLVPDLYEVSFIGEYLEHISYIAITTVNISQHYSDAKKCDLDNVTSLSFSNGNATFGFKDPRMCEIVGKIPLLMKYVRLYGEFNGFILFVNSVVTGTGGNFEFTCECPDVSLFTKFVALVDFMANFPADDIFLEELKSRLIQVALSLRPRSLYLFINVSHEDDPRLVNVKVPQCANVLQFLVLTALAMKKSISSISFTGLELDNATFMGAIRGEILQNVVAH